VLQDPEVDVIVPGHGPLGGKKDLVEMRDYLTLLADAARKGIAAGIGAGRVAAELDLGKYATWTDPDRVVNNVARVYSELKGTVGTPADREITRDAVTEYNQLKKR
jgi:cyclase